MSNLIWIAVTGGRGYQNYQHVERVLDEERPSVVVQGECPYGGADLLTKRWCEKRGVPCVGLPALWDFYGNPAGPIRNGWMFDLFPIYKLVAFPGDRGTKNAVDQARKREVLVRDERQPAQGIEAQRAATVKQGAVHESPVAESDAPEHPLVPPQSVGSE